jgi:putative addiction module killer protein
MQCLARQGQCCPRRRRCQAEAALTAKGVDVFEAWLDGLADATAAARIISRVDRVQAGNFGDHKPVGEGVLELRIDHGPGYRVYYALAGQRVVLLLCGGNKRKQAADIRRAIAMWKDYNERAPKP